MHGAVFAETPQSVRALVDDVQRRMRAAFKA